MTYDGSAAPAAQLPLLRTSVERLHASAAALTDDDVRAPSLLPGWTRAHVLTHIARSADSRTRLLTAARTGADLPQYEDEAQREREIEEGAGRAAAELAADLRGALGGFLTAAAGHPDAAWEVPVRWLGGGCAPCGAPSAACCVRWRCTTQTWGAVTGLWTGPRTSSPANS